MASLPSVILTGYLGSSGKSYKTSVIVYLRRKICKSIVVHSCMMYLSVCNIICCYVALLHSAVRELEDRVSEQEDEGRQQTDSLRRQVGETELIREREDRLKQELQVSVAHA